MKLEKFLALTGYQFSTKELLEQALTHRSYSRSVNNERLEFLGDSILNLIISRHIYQRFADASEGDLSRLRAVLVKQASLAQVARDLGLGEFILLGGGEMKSGGHRRDSILSDAMEAVIGAIYLDSDFNQTETVVLRLYEFQLNQLNQEDNLKDPKTRLQEYLQGRKMEIPSYTVVKTSGKSHSQLFTVDCVLAELDMHAEGQGSSRKKAEQLAAQKLLQRLNQ